MGPRRELSYIELHAEVGRIAHALKELGVGVGDRVAGFMPNIPETVIAMLAATSLGATWSSCSPDFGIDGVVDRFGQIAPKVLFTADGYGYGGKRFDCLAKDPRRAASRSRASRSSSSCPTRAMRSTLDGLRDAIAWPDFAGSDDHALQFEMLPFDHPLYIMYSSGTTGVPKCIVHGAGGTLIQHLKELVLHTDLKREDRLFYFTTCGWMMWNWFVSGLAVGATLVLYDGSPSHPDGNALWDLADEVGISVFGTSAKWISATEKAGVKPRETHKLLQLKTILSTGSPLAPESYDYVYRDVKERVLLASISGGTDIISCFALGNPLLPVYRGELQCRGLGMKVEIFDDAGQSGRASEKGELACTAPFPSMPVFFWNDPDGAKYRKAYFSRIPERLVPRRSCAADRARRHRHLRPLGRDAESRRRAHRHRRDLPPGRADRRDPRIDRGRPALAGRRARDPVRAPARRRCARRRAARAHQKAHPRQHDAAPRAREDHRRSPTSRARSRARSPRSRCAIRSTGCR